jgi:hypothetical protein
MGELWIRQRYKCEVITLDHIHACINKFVHDNWAALQAAQLKDPVLGLLTLFEKAAAAEVKTNGKESAVSV